jgi:GntR family transcriptional regulator
MNQPLQGASGSLPIYVQISEILIREIGAGRLLDNERLPPERDMAKQYGVAVGTLRKALKLLASQGLLVRRQGSGNYVRIREQSANVYAFFRLELLEGGGLPTAKTLSIDKRDKPSNFPKFGSADFGFRFRRLRFLDGKLAALEEIWMDGNCATDTQLNSVSESLYHFYREKLGIWITRAEDRVSIAPIPVWGMKQFEHPPKSEVGYIQRIAFDRDGKSVEYSRNWFDPKIASYVSRIK